MANVFFFLQNSLLHALVTTFLTNFFTIVYFHVPKITNQIYRYLKNSFKL